MHSKLDGRTALIAGGAGGMGLASAESLGKAGFRVVIADLPSLRLQAATDHLRALGIEALGLAFDITRPQACREVAEAAARWGGRIDALVNSAGIWAEGAPEEMTEATWDSVLAVNLKGPFFLIQAALPHMPRGGSIVNIASDAGLVGNRGASVYCASKGGLVVMTKALALDLAPRGIRANAICPGDVATPMIEAQAQRFGKGDPDRYKADLLAHYPQGETARFIAPQEVARMVAYLCEDAACPVTGAALSIDFGVTAGY